VPLALPFFRHAEDGTFPVRCFTLTVDFPGSRFVRALITGVSGQDGSYLAEFLLDRGYEVIGVSRDPAAARAKLGASGERIELVEGSLAATTALRRLLAQARPDEVYNLAGQTRIGPSWDDPEATADVNALGVTRLLEAVRQESSRVKLFQATSSEIFEESPYPLDEGARLGANTPYGITKLHAHLMVRAYRERYGLFAVSGILFNHESPRRDENFVTRKITRAVARIAAGEQRELHLGNLEARRDWGFAADYVEAMWRMLQRGEAEDFVIGTGVAHSVRDFVGEAFRAAGLSAEGRVVSDTALLRPGDVPVRVADAGRARALLGWTPRVSFTELVRLMVQADTDALRR
jgi:GDPmannose 4,6-dehydratase